MSNVCALPVVEASMFGVAERLQQQRWRVGIGALAKNAHEKQN